MAIQVVERRLPLAEIPGHHPVDQGADLLLDLVWGVSHDLALELTLDTLGVDQVKNAGQAQCLVEIDHAPIVHRQQHLFDVGQAIAEIVLHVGPIDIELSFDVLDGFQIFGQQRQAVPCQLQVFRRYPLAHAHGAAEFELDPALGIQRLVDIGLYPFKVARRPQGIALSGRLGQFGFERQPGRHGKHFRREAQQGQGILADKLYHLGHLGFLKKVDLVEEDDHFFAPFADALHKGPLTLGERAVGRGDENHQIAAGDKFFSQLLVATDDGIGARCVYDVDLPQKGSRVGHGQHPILCYLAL